MDACEQERKVRLATWFMGVCSVILVIGVVYNTLGGTQVPGSLAALTGTVLGYLASLLAHTNQPTDVDKRKPRG